MSDSRVTSEEHSKEKTKKGGEEGEVKKEIYDSGRSERMRRKIRECSSSFGEKTFESDATKEKNKMNEEEEEVVRTRGESEYKKSLGNEYEYYGGSRKYCYGVAGEPEFAYEEAATQKGVTGPKKRAKNRICSNCQATSTPSWIRAGNGKDLLCNACGLYQKLHNRSRPYSITPEGRTKALKGGSGERSICVACNRSFVLSDSKKSAVGSLCEACLIYFKNQTANDEVLSNKAYCYNGYPERYRMNDYNSLQGFYYSIGTGYNQDIYMAPNYYPQSTIIPYRQSLEYRNDDDTSLPYTSDGSAYPSDYSSYERTGGYNIFLSPEFKTTSKKGKSTRSYTSRDTKPRDSLE